jgi:uncharacterized membrane protein YccF (DUF307 family)
MSTIGNLIWLLFGGIFIALEYFVSSLVLLITIIIMNVLWLILGGR